MKINIHSTLRKYIIKNSRELEAAASRCVKLTGLEDNLQLHKTDAEMEIIFVGRKKILQMNREFLGHDYATDVIAFGYAGRGNSQPVPGSTTIGELYICPPVADIVRKRYETTLSREIVLYMIHGMLHIAGYEDGSDIEKDRMKHAEQKVLTTLSEDCSDLDSLFTVSPRNKDS